MTIFPFIGACMNKPVCPQHSKRRGRFFEFTIFLLLSGTALSDVPAGLLEEQVRYPSGDVDIAGVVVRPAGDSPHPGVVLVDGSGETDRHNMRDFSIALAQAGFVTLAYDKRGVGESTGDPQSWRYFSIAELAADAAAGVEFLAARDDVAENDIGLLGLSQGGWVAPLAATLTDTVSFMVLLSPSVTTIAEDRVFERAARLRAEGFSAAEVAEVREMQLLDQHLTRTGKNFADFQSMWHDNASKRWFRRVYLTDALLDPASEYRSWYRTVLDFDPRPYLSALSIPVLWLFGDPELDHLTPVAASIINVEVLRGQGKDYTIYQFPGTDHNIMPVDDVATDVHETMPPYAEPLMEWLKERNGG